MASSKSKRNIFDIFVKLALVATVCGCLVSIVTTQSTISEKEKELSELKSKKETLEAENGEYQRILDADDIDAYMELIAIENMNYAYPNERRFYDTSRN